MKGPKHYSSFSSPQLTPLPTYSQFFELKRPLEFIQKPKRLQLVCTVTCTKDNTFKIQNPHKDQKEEWVNFLGQVSKFHVTVLEIKNAQLSSIINYFSVIQFTKLRDLSLCNLRLITDGNKIFSLENLHKIHLPELKTLRIDQNQITSLRSLKKCSFPLLQQIDLQNNEWNDPQWMTQMNAPMLTVVRLEQWTHTYPRDDDKKWFAKLQSPLLNYIRCPSSKRMRQRVVEEMLKRKYYKLNVMRNNSG